MVSVFFNRGNDFKKSRFFYHPTPASLVRVMRWQAAVKLAERDFENDKLPSA
jgi:hypothetical protein